MSNQLQVDLQEWMGSDRRIAESAWVSSTDKTKRDSKDDTEVERIVNMLADSQHGVPFESVVMRFWIRCPLHVDRQLVTHRIASHNGLSARYRTVPLDYLNIPDDVYNILHKSTDKLPIDKLDKWRLESNPKSSIPDLPSLYYESLELAMANYEWGIKYLKFAEKEHLISNEEFKRAREIWRGIVPTAGMTERVITINLRSFANFIKLRLSEHAQPEIRKVAELMLQAVRDANICPVAIAALERNNWVI